MVPRAASHFGALSVPEQGGVREGAHGVVLASERRGVSTNFFRYGGVFYLFLAGQPASSPNLVRSPLACNLWAESDLWALTLHR